MNWKDVYRIEYITASKPDDEWAKEILRSALYTKFPDLKDEDENLRKMIAQKREYDNCQAFYLDEELLCVITRPELKSGIEPGAYSTPVLYPTIFLNNCPSMHYQVAKHVLFPTSSVQKWPSEVGIAGVMDKSGSRKKIIG